jgi:hypothetical protein
MEQVPMPHKADLPPLPEALQREFYEDVLQAALTAEARVGPIERYFDIAGARLRIIFAGPALEAALTGALAHIEVPAGPADATFHVWDTESTDVTMRPPPCPVDCFTDRGDIWGMAGDRYRFAFHWSEFSVNVADPRTGVSVYWVRSVDVLPYWAKASPLRTLIHWMMETRGCQLLHAAAVGDAEGAVLITGRGGSGKSTTALACLAAGMHYVGDDYLVVQPGDPDTGIAPRAVSLYATAKLNPEQADRFPQFAALITNRHAVSDEKAVLGLWPAREAQIVRSLPIRAVLTPEITPREQTDFAPVSRTALQHAASFTTMSQLPYAGRWTHTFIDTLIGSVPGLTIRLGSDLNGVSRAIATLLGRDAAEISALAGPVVVPMGGHHVAAPPLVTVIIPVFNGAAFLPEAVASVLAQNYPSLEIIVVDDGSEDAIEAAVARLPTDVRFFRQPNNGPASARNRGIRDASGEFIAFLDADDLWPEHTLPVLVDALLAHPETHVVRGHAQIVRKNPESGELDYVGNPAESFAHYIGAGLYRREAFQKVGLFDTGLRFNEDSDWYVRARGLGVGLDRLPRVTLLVRRHEQNMTRGRSSQEMGQLRLLRKAIAVGRVAAKPDP